MFKRKEELLKHLEENEAKYREMENPDFEKGDKLAIVIAFFMVFVPVILIMVILFLFLYFLL